MTKIEAKYELGQELWFQNSKGNPTKCRVTMVRADVTKDGTEISYCVLYTPENDPLNEKLTHLDEREVAATKEELKQLVISKFN